jgi:ribosomal protein L44E
MAEHYTLLTKEASAWCAKCRKNTMHTVSGHRKGSCIACMERLENAPKVAPPAKQERLF